MLDSLKNKQLSATMTKHFILLNLIFPLYSSRFSSAYSPNIVYGNIFAVMFICLAFAQGNFDWKRKNWLGYLIAIFLVCFNIFAFYASYNNDHWYAGPINVSIAFLFFLTWLFMKDTALCMGEDLVKFLLYAAAITNAVGLLPGLMGSSMVSISVNGYSLVPKDPADPTYSWIYLHKSEYSFMLVLFLALTVTYRRLYEKKWQFWGTIAVYSAGLVIANTRATMLAALFILAGVILDDMVKKAGGFKLRYLLYFVPIIAIGIVMLIIFSRERNILTLGHRTYIWAGAVNRILDVPWGIGAMCGLQPFSLEGVGFQVWNCHNVFLNYFLQFSIPAGFFYLMMMVSIIVASIKKNLSFQTLGIWVALLIPLNMDWCVLLAQVPMMLLVLYFMFFHKASAKI